jgi:hypothetical protein
MEKVIVKNIKNGTKIKILTFGARHLGEFQLAGKKLNLVV